MASATPSSPPPERRHPARISSTPASCPSAPGRHLKKEGGQLSSNACPGFTLGSRRLRGSSRSEPAAPARETSPLSLPPPPRLSKSLRLDHPANLVEDYSGQQQLSPSNGSFAGCRSGPGKRPAKWGRFNQETRHGAQIGLRSLPAPGGLQRASPSDCSSSSSRRRKLLLAAFGEARKAALGRLLPVPFPRWIDSAIPPPPAPSSRPGREIGASKRGCRKPAGQPLPNLPVPFRSRPRRRWGVQDRCKKEIYIYRKIQVFTKDHPAKGERRAVAPSSFGVSLNGARIL